MEQHSHVFKVTYVKMYVFCFVFLFLFFDPALMMISFQILQDPLEKLREAIGKVMPGQLARFHDNRQAHAQVKSTKYAHGGLVLPQ